MPGSERFYTDDKLKFSDEVCSSEKDKYPQKNTNVISHIKSRYFKTTFSIKFKYFYQRVLAVASFTFYPHTHQSECNHLFWPDLVGDDYSKETLT